MRPPAIQVISTDEIEELKIAHRNGKWGFSHTLDFTQLTPISMLTSEVPPWMARPWTVTLSGMRYTSGPLANVAHPTPDPPDNQVPVELKVRIDYGIDSGRETVDVDYPWAGCTFQVHASSIRLYLLPPATQNYNIDKPPLLNATMSPFPQGRGATDIIGPTWTHAYTFPPSSTLYVPIPRRAIAYRLVPTNSSSLAPAIACFQAAGGIISGNIDVAIDYATELLTTNDASAFPKLFPNRGFLMPILPYASMLKIQTPALTFPCSIQYLLDIG